MGKFGRPLVGFLFISKTVLEVGWSFILWSMMLYLESWSARSSDFIGVAQQVKDYVCRNNEFSAKKNFV